MKTAPSIPAAKIKMMKTSIRCLVLGLMSLIPIIGLGFAPFGFWYASAARRQEKSFWNPAQPHRIFGLWCASMGALIWGIVDIILIGSLVNKYVSS